LKAIIVCLNLYVKTTANTTVESCVCVIKKDRLYVCSVAKPRTRQHNLDALVRERGKERDEEKGKK
jgi:hypothetical protein